MKTLKNRLLVAGLQRYSSRYTELLPEWENEAFEPVFDVERIEVGDAREVTSIQSGRVLDRDGLPLRTLEQARQLLTKIQPADKLYISDFYFPGLDALAYSGRKPKTGAFCWANTFDVYDFTTEMIDWMRPWEAMAFNIYDVVFVADPLLKELMVTAFPWVADKIVVTGLPFNSEQVLGIAPKAASNPERHFDVVYSSRWDFEKQPRLFMELVVSRPDLKFVVCTGHAELCGTDQKSVAFAKAWATTEKGAELIFGGTVYTAYGNLSICSGLTKPEYYAILGNSKVQANFSLQDWISFTLLEAVTFGCQPLYPNFRSFPRALHYQDASLYAPGSVERASDKLDRLLTRSLDPDYRSAILEPHDQALGLIARVMNNL